jgi:predicted DNA-binding transcriptional regulator YafY
MTSDESRKRLGRILAMVPLASARDGADIVELCEFLGCTVDELMRDVETLIMCGVPPYTPSDYTQAYVEDGRLHITFPANFRRPVRLSAEEHAAVQCALLQAARVAGDSGADAVKSLMAKFGRTRRPKGLREKDVVDCSVQVAIPERKRILFQKAIEERRKILIEYHSLRSGETEQRIVRPYAVVARSRHWYLIAHDEKRGKAIPFRGDRIRRAVLTAETFERREDFDVAKYLEGRMYFDAQPATEALVRFGPEYARFIAERFPPEMLKRDGDGSVEVRLQTDSLKWAARWVMKFGPYATASSPAELREEIVKTCDQVLAAYGAREDVFPQ